MIIERFTLTHCKLVPNEDGELVRYQDLEAVQRALAELQETHRAMRDAAGAAADDARARLNEAGGQIAELRAMLAKIRRQVCELVPGPAPLPQEKVDELARGMVAQLQKAIAPQ